MDIKIKHLQLKEEIQKKLIKDIKDFLPQITSIDCKVEPIRKQDIKLNPSILITLPLPDAAESRWIMQAFNTKIYRARRAKRSFQSIEVTYREKKNE